MKRLLILLGLLLLTLGVYYFSISKGDKKMDALKAERAFDVSADLVHKIVISERNKKPILLQRNSNDTWQVNQKFLARENAIDNLLEIVENVQIKYIPEQQANKNILKEIRTIGIQVDVYGQNDDLLKSYQVGGSTADERGTYVMMSDSQKPFAVVIPSMEGSIRGRYILSELDWRDRSVIKEDPKNLAYVNVEYYDQAKNSFEITRHEGGESLVKDRDGNILESDQNKLRAYIEGFDQVYAEYIDNLNPLRDSISSLQPFVKISYGRTKLDHKSIRLFPLSELIFEEDELTDADKVKLDGRYFVDCSWGDFMLVQHRLIGKLLRGKSFFETE